MGIGSGAGVFNSGEIAIFNFLKQIPSHPHTLCIFDVGSNNGQFLQLTLENIETDNFFIHCFEPSQETFRNLVESFREDMRINLNNFGIGKKNADTVLYTNKAGSGLASLTKRRLDHLNIDFNKSEKIKIRTIDSYCSEKNITHIHLLKIDIEGHELDALYGASTMFNRKSVDIVTFEFGGCNIDTRTFFQDFWYYFSEIDYKIFRITPSGYLYPIESYNEIHEQFRTTNYIALSNG